MKQFVFLILFCLFMVGKGLAQNEVERLPLISDKKVSLGFDTRMDLQANIYESTGDTSLDRKPEYGFLGKYLSLNVSGQINDKFSYVFRQRLYTQHLNPKELFTATDFAYLTYREKNFSVTAGKQMVMLGGYEFDFAPIDFYFGSNFSETFSGYELGVNAGYHSSDQKHDLFVQVINSPLSGGKLLSGQMAYGILWYGRICPWFNTIYSVNMVEFKKGSYLNYISLGNRFMFHGFTIDFDFMNRYGAGNPSFFSDFATILQVKYDIINKLDVFVRVAYEHNEGLNQAGHAQVEKNACTYGLGIEYYPIVTDKNKVRIHAFWNSSTSSPVPHTINVGARWRITAFEIDHKNKK